MKGTWIKRAADCVSTVLCLREAVPMARFRPPHMFETHVIYVSWT